AALPRDLRARVEERVYLEWEEQGRTTGRIVVPDVRVVEYPYVGSDSASDEPVLVADPALRVRPFDEPTVERFIEIRDFSTGGRLVTVIEVLSPSNKGPGSGRASYLKKREELHEARVSLVEIDLLRSGEPIDAVPRSELPEEYHTPYLITVSREETAGRGYEVYKVPIDRRLPVIAVPLRPGDDDALLDLQSVLNDVYDRGGYDIVDYRRPPNPPLPADLTDWADRVLRQSGSAHTSDDVEHREAD
ncbi:MAG: DUF4058 family protein, partial [Thermoguttaceae bacterium]